MLQNGRLPPLVTDKTCKDKTSSLSPDHKGRKTGHDWVSNHNRNGGTLRKETYEQRKGEGVSPHDTSLRLINLVNKQPLITPPPPRILRQETLIPASTLYLEAKGVRFGWGGPGWAGPPPPYTHSFSFLFWLLKEAARPFILTTDDSPPEVFPPPSQCHSNAFFVKRFNACSYLPQWKHNVYWFKDEMCSVWLPDTDIIEVSFSPINVMIWRSRLKLTPSVGSSPWIQILCITTSQTVGGIGWGLRPPPPALCPLSVFHAPPHLMSWLAAINLLNRSFWRACVHGLVTDQKPPRGYLCDFISSAFIFLLWHVGKMRRLWDETWEMRELGEAHQTPRHPHLPPGQVSGVPL